MRTFLLLLTCSMVTLSTHAQGGVSELLETRHIVKTNLLSYVVLAVNANYEYKTSPSTSVGLLGGYKIPQTFSVTAIGELDGETMTYTGDVEPSGLFLSPYFRYYVSGAMSGFYLEAFGRYASYDFTFPYDYERTRDGVPESVSTALLGEYTATGGGIGLGGQFSLAERVFLDINFGAGVVVADVFVETNDETLTPEDYQNIRQEIEENSETADVDIFVIGNPTEDIEVVAEDDRVFGTISDQIIPILRGGISIGYAF